jgi:hypothetical protein
MGGEIANFYIESLLLDWGQGFEVQAQLLQLMQHIQGAILVAIPKNPVLMVLTPS